MIRAALAVLLLCAFSLLPEPAAAQMLRRAPAAPISSPNPPVTLTLTLPQPACKTLSPAHWQRVLTVMRRRLSAYAKIYKNGSGQVARSGPCNLSVLAFGIQDPKALATVLARRGQLVIYGMGNLPQYPRGAPFTQATHARCDVPHAPTPCVVIDGSDLDLRQVDLVYDTFGQPEVRFGTNKAGTPSTLTITTARGATVVSITS